MSETPWKACPREDCEIVRDSVTTGTLKAWVQTYDKHGRPTSVDPNLYETFLHCNRCGTCWLERRQAGKTAYITPTPPAEAAT